MKFKDILYDKKDGIAIATLNRPNSLNAFRESTFKDLIGILEDIRTDDTIHVLVITGNGRAFSAGEDLKELASQLDAYSSLKQVRDKLRSVQNVTRCIVNLPKIIIAAVNGIAVGLGVEIAIACDIRIASESATFAFPEVKRGLFETNGVMYHLPRLVGMGRAMEWLLTGDNISAQDALNAGLVNNMVPGDRLLEFTLGLSRKIAANAPISVRLVKQVMRRSYDLDLEAVMQLEVDGVMECLSSEDFVEGARAFVEKRTPVYKGK